MTTLEIPDRYLVLAPIIVTSPTTRCGTTLLQRLLSASDNAFVFGEDASQHIRSLTEIFVNLMRQFEDVGESIDADFARALAGELVDWRPGLSPPTGVMLRAWVETYYQIPSALDDFSRKIGRPIWGFKCPGYSRDLLKALLTMLPHAKVIYVYRNPFDALKSAKARKFVVSASDADEFCSQWARNVSEVSDLCERGNVLTLKYETLISRREECVGVVERFTGAAHIDLRAFDLKINTFEGDRAQGHSPTQYIAPATLTAGDRASIAAHAGRLLEQLYPELTRRGQTA